MDRFELEDKITAINNVNEELEVLSRRVLEEDLDRDDIVNAINGIMVLQAGRWNELWDTFIQSFQLDQYSSLFNDEDCGYSEDTNPSVDLNFIKKQSCQKYGDYWNKKYKDV